MHQKSDAVPGLCGCPTLRESNDLREEVHKDPCILKRGTRIIGVPGEIMRKNLVMGILV